MSIQYSGGAKIFPSFLGDTIANLKTAVNTNLITAGWASANIAGGFQMTSATTPQSLSCIIKLLDDGTNVTIQFFDTTLTKVGFLHHIPVAANKRFTLIANQYQFFLFVPNVSATGSGAVMGGVPWVPAFLQAGTTTAIWSIGDESSSVTLRNSLVPASTAATFIFNTTVATGGGIGSPRLIGIQSNATAFGLAGLWFNNAAIICEPMLAYGTSNAAVPFIVGELWDTALVMQPYQLDLATNFDTHNYQNITDNNANGSVFVATS